MNKNEEILNLKNQILELKNQNLILQNNLQGLENEKLENQVNYFDKFFTQTGVNLLIELNEKYKTLYQTLNTYTNVIIDAEKEIRFIADLLTGKIKITKNERKDL